jgi:hypothetical protein
MLQCSDSSQFCLQSCNIKGHFNRHLHAFLGTEMCLESFGESPSKQAPDSPRHCTLFLSCISCLSSFLPHKYVFYCLSFLKCFWFPFFFILHWPYFFRFLLPFLFLCPFLSSFFLYLFLFSLILSCFSGFLTLSRKQRTPYRHVLSVCVFVCSVIQLIRLFSTYQCPYDPCCHLSVAIGMNSAATH